MRKLDSLQKDFIATIVVLLFAVVYLSIINYQNHSDGKKVSARQLPHSVQILEDQSSEQIYIFKNLAEAQNSFPEFDAKINWDKNIVIAYIGLPQPNPGYTIELVEAKREANYLNITYKTLSPSSDTGIISVVAYPALFISVPRNDLVASSDMHIQFIENTTRHTKTLTLPPNEI